MDSYRRNDCRYSDSLYSRQRLKRTRKTLIDMRCSKGRLAVYGGLLSAVVLAIFYFAPVRSQEENSLQENEAVLSKTQKVHVLVYHSIRPYYDEMTEDVRQYTVY